MTQTSGSVRAFFDLYESNIRGADPQAIAAQYGDSFVFSGPQGGQAVRRDDFIKVLPKRQEFVKAAGLQSTTLVALEEARIDDRCVLVKVQWRLRFGSATASSAVSELDLFSTYLLQRHPDGLRIVFQLDHDDLAARVKELGVTA